MPGRKSNVSVTSNGPEEATEAVAAKGGKDKDKDGLSVDDLSLPKSMIARLAKGVLPANTQIHKDALLALHKSATVFVSYIASNSNDNAQAGGKKTISPQDVMAALKDAELEEFIPRLEAELKRYNEIQCDKRNTYRKKVKEEKAAATQEGGEGGSKDGGSTNGTNSDPIVLTDRTEPDDGGERPAKKMKGEGGEAVQADQDGDDADDDEGDDDQDGDDQDDEGDDGGADSEVDEENDESGDDTMEDALEEIEERGELRDEALDEPDSD
ncbi:unnamed protein product [Zymoseptoria tritici ST99CH_3D7]|uniref:DNA polymerase epsilon subunit D n=2 Tax=Zymoseptoria tritici TaxID=1047171 RepID=A0A1X7RHI4_ZYMT9|nr:unnamed protein product [Zymoseptoria tritici ST99CH_3D7]SMR43229.1 unnamed protein product [Zymoseptoria tritici ST99CH_1E4]